MIIILLNESVGDMRNILIETKIIYLCMYIVLLLLVAKF